MTELTPEQMAENRRRYEVERERHEQRIWIEAADRGDYHAGYICGQEVEQGGWYEPPDGTWMTKSDLEAAEKRAWQRSDDSGPKEDGGNGNDRIPNQCGGCHWFAALNANWGICSDEASPNDGRVVFEHGGCAAHSALVPTTVSKP